MRSPLIFRVFKNNQLKEVKQFDQDQIVIGHNADVHLDLDGSGISPIHCLVEKRDSGFYLCDLGSQTGTFKNGQAILDEQIESGDELNIGEFKLQFFVGIPKPKAAPVSPVNTPPAKKAVETKVEVKPEDIKVRETPVIPNLAIERPEVPKKPEIRAAPKSQKKKTSGGTFAPPSSIADMTSYLSTGKGTHLEVMLIWGDRVLNSYHFSKKGVVKAGNSEDPFHLPLPSTFAKAGFPIFDLRNGVSIQGTQDMSFIVKNSDEVMEESHSKVQSRLQSRGSVKTLRLEQNEIVFVSSKSSPLQLAVRFCPQTSSASLLPPMILSASEISALIIAVVMMGMLKMYIDSTAPQDWELKQQEEVQRVAQVVFNPPPEALKPPPPSEATPPPPPPPPPPPEKAQLADQSKESAKKGEQNKAADGKTQTAARANEVAPKPNSKKRPKSFTSVKQGGAVKMGATAGANAKSANQDPNNVGLLSAFGSGGVRQKLDQAYSGSGELLGMADKATGTSGFAENRAGDDLGSRFKDTGAGGKGTATTGIAGVGTKGRSGGQSAYGSSDGFGDKTSVSVQSGGLEESFVGTIDREAIRRVIRAKLFEVKSCYERVLNTLPKGQRMEGKVVIKWEIVEKGQAKQVRVKSSSLGSAQVESCIVNRLQQWVFPEPPVNTVAEVEYPFILNQAN